ncbi:MAG: hypothetical protein JXR91_11645, partial [Deltaproteobacteria bacterium]|nr:hypothetical protein [Deltaproteobacteria bacterium]
VNQQFNVMRPLTVEEVHVSIIKALASKGWRIVDDKPGVILAKVQVSVHFANIKIDYSISNYSITLINSSPGLKYKDQGYRKVIHRRYNNWINQLDQAIYNELTQVATNPSPSLSLPPISPPPPAEPKTTIINNPPVQTPQETQPVQIPQEAPRESAPAHLN